MSGWNEAAWVSIFIGLALKGTAVLGVAWLSAFLLRGRSAAARHLVWTAAAAAVLALPFLSVSLPALHVSSELFPTSIGVVYHATAIARPGTPVPVPPVRYGNEASSLKVPAWRPDWKLWLMLLWAAGAAAAIAQMLVACAAIWRVRRSAKPFSDLDPCVALARAIGIRSAVSVLETEPGSMPMTFGIMRSAIFMPSDATHWSEERRRVVLLHELAHVRRGDVATHMLARTALALYWWNPLAWIAWREFLKERERAADDLVLNAGERASEYARHLLEVARSMQSDPAIGWAAVAMARPSQLEGRLRAILDSDVNRKTPGRGWSLVAALLAVAMVAPLAAVRAQDSKAPAIPADVDAAIRAAMSQKNHEILEDAAKAAEQLQKYDTAQTLLQSAAAIRAQVSGEQSMEYGIGLLNLGDLEQKRRDSKSAEYFYTKAAQVLGERPEAAPALMYLGTAALVKKDLPQAAVYFQRAQNLDPAHAGRALMWLAIVRRNEAKPDEAETLFKSALSAQDPTSLDTATTLQVYAQFLRKQSRDEEARGLDARASAIQKALGATVTLKFKVTDGIYRIGGDVTAPTVLTKVEPEYTEVARAALLSGTVSVSVEIGPDGLAHNPRILRPLGLGLEEKAIEAITQWRFRPGTKDGQAVTVAATIEVNFRLL
jgi:TonB family protein